MKNMEKGSVQMKRETLDATDKNILESIKDSKIPGRDKDIEECIEAIKMIEGNMFISLDARWGEGKTFYVRQIEKTLEYLTLKQFGDDENATAQAKLQELKPYFEETNLETIKMEKSYLPIYYNAWLYDNHTDPLLSLIFVIIKKYQHYVNTNKPKKISEKLKKLISAVSINIAINKNIQMTIDPNVVVDSLSNTDILEEIKTAEEIKETVKEILNDIISGSVSKLVIFIDELDRCKPSFALEMLERIKHYFDDDRIIFIVSVNKEQLTHTISNYYGIGFDSTGYLNKFFDYEMHLPDTRMLNGDVTSYVQNKYWVTQIAEELKRYYKLSLRDAIIYNGKIKQLDKDQLLSDSSVRGYYLSLFVPVVIILDMVDVQEKRKFISGESTVLEKIMKLPEILKFTRRIGANGSEQINAVYKFAFADADEKVLIERDISVADIGRNLKEECLKRTGI